MKKHTYLNAENSIFIVLYITLFIGFFLNEDLVGGASLDYVTYQDWVNLFSKDIKNSLLNYDELGERHSPIIILYLTLFKKIGLTDEITRLINLNISLVIFYFFYKCLCIKFPETDKKYFVILSSVIFLSPTLRALAIWPDSRIYGLSFFVISVYFFLKFQDTKNFKFVLLNIFFLSISAYISPNFSLFSIFFFIKYFLIYKFTKKIFFIILFNLILAFPAFYYLFILDVMFLFEGGTPGDQSKIGLFPNRLNFSNKIILISNLILFYLLPLISSKLYTLKKIKLSNIILVFLLCLPITFFFNYNLVESTGGGIFYHLSWKLLDSNLIVYVIFIISSFVIFDIVKKNKFNLLIIVLLIISNVQLTVYHKYYDPLLLILFFTLFNIEIKKLEIKNIIHIYSFSIFFLMINFFF